MRGRWWRVRANGSGARGILAACACGCALVSGIAGATEIKFPKTKPQIELKVPDDWSASYTPAGLELRSPDKTAFVIANIVKRDKPAVDAWTKAAASAMEAEGVVFDKTWKPKSLPEAGTSAVVSNVPVDSGIPMFARRSVRQEEEKEQVAQAPRMLAAPPPRTESGRTDGGVASVAGPEPSGPTPSTVPAMAAAPPMASQRVSPALQAFASPASSAAAPEKIGGMSFRVAQYFGAKRDSHPVDVQLLVMNMGKDELFMIEHESTSADNRTVAIVESTRQVH